MCIDTDEELQGLKRIGAVVADTLRHMISNVEIGMRTNELDAIGRARLEYWEARSAPILCYGFPGATCISVNEEVAHGIPGERVISAGDVVNIDISAELGGYFSDIGATILVPPVAEVSSRLVDATKRALTNAIASVKSDVHLNVIGKAIEEVASGDGFSVLKNLGSHGIGRALHEEPSFIPGFFDPTDPRILKKGSVITIEPFLSNGVTNATSSADGWTLLGGPGTTTVQFEHTIVVTDGTPIVLTALEGLPH